MALRGTCAEEEDEEKDEGERGREEEGEVLRGRGLALRRACAEIFLITLRGPCAQKKHRRHIQSNTKVKNGAAKSNLLFVRPLQDFGCGGVFLDFRVPSEISKGPRGKPNPLSKGPTSRGYLLLTL